MRVLLHADQRLKQNNRDVLLPAYPQELYPSENREWTDVEPEVYSPVDHPVSKQLSTLVKKNNNRDVLLQAYPQELYPSGNESGLMLCQKTYVE